MNRPVDPADNHAQLSWCTSVPTVSVLPSRPERSEPTCKTRLHVACHRVATPPRSRLFLRSREARAVSGEDKSAVVVGRGGHTAGAADRISRAGGMCECNTSIIPSASIFGTQCKRRTGGNEQQELVLRNAACAVDHCADAGTRSQIGSRSVVLTSAYERTATKAAAIARDRDGLGDGEPEPVGAGLEEKTPIDPFIFMDELIDCATSY
jgi:hypothetical protein